MNSTFVVFMLFYVHLLQKAKIFYIFSSVTIQRSCVKWLKNHKAISIKIVIGLKENRNAPQQDPNS